MAYTLSMVGGTQHWYSKSAANCSSESPFTGAESSSRWGRGRPLGSTQGPHQSQGTDLLARTENFEDWCQQCEDCVESKYPSTSAHGPLSPSVVGYPMERIVLNVLRPLPVTQDGNKYILVVSDYFTCWVEAYPLPN